MNASMRLKWQRFIALLLARLSENSTIQGIAAVVTLGTGLVVDDGKMAGWVALAAGISAILKIFLPDNWTRP